MLANKLKQNSDKTEILVFSSCYYPRPTLNILVIASETVDCSTTAKNIGVIFNNSLSMLLHVTAVCKSSFFHLRNVFKIRNFLCYDTCKILIHACNTSRIDYRPFATNDHMVHGGGQAHYYSRSGTLKQRDLNQ